MPRRLRRSTQKSALQEDHVAIWLVHKRMPAADQYCRRYFSNEMPESVQVGKNESQKENAAVAEE